MHRQQDDEFEIIRDTNPEEGSGIPPNKAKIQFIQRLKSFLKKEKGSFIMDQLLLTLGDALSQD
jgi:hypothetical protein